MANAKKSSCSYGGVSRGTVSGIVNRLKQKKVIETDGHMIVRCRNICEFELKTQNEEVKSGVNWLSVAFV